MGSDREVLDDLWAANYDVGIKWIRVGFWTGDPLLWHNVEQEKGRYHIDERTDEAISEAVENGCEIVLTLAYGNWLYAPEPKSNYAENIWPIPYNFPPLPITPEAREGYLRYARFMVKHFKGRIRYYEVWNEPDLQRWTVEEYCDLLKQAANVIHEEDPEAKVVLGSSSVVAPFTYPKSAFAWHYDALGEGVAEYVDAIGWHPFYNTNIDSFCYRNYPKYVRELQQAAQEHGFEGEYMATELTWGTKYPPLSYTFFGPQGALYVSDIEKAKNAARCFVMHCGLSVIPFWCDVIDTELRFGQNLFRQGFASEPVSQLTTEPIYYVIRTLCTLLDWADPIDLAPDREIT